MKLMKLLIIEGPDRCGKNTLIQNFTKQADNSVVRHWGSAKGKNDLDKKQYQYDFFNNEFQLASSRFKFSRPDTERYPHDIWIWNRAHLGEFVYGDLYRNTDPSEWVFPMEKKFGFDIDPSIYLVLLTAPAQFLCSQEDGKSFSADPTNKRAELHKFRSAFDSSSIKHKLIVDVTRMDSNGHINYRDSSGDEVFNEVNKFVFG